MPTRSDLVRFSVFFALAGFSAGCGEPQSASCTPGTHVFYDPLAQNLDAFPDDFFTVEDSATPTGLRVHVKPGDNVAMQGAYDKFLLLFDDLSRLDGFGTTSQLFMRLSAKLPDSVMGQKNAVMLLDMDAPASAWDSGAKGAIVDVDLRQVIEDDPIDTSVVLVVTPVRTLEPKHHYALVVPAKTVGTGDGTCDPASATMRSLLDGSAADPKLARLAPRYRDLVSKLTAAGLITGHKDLASAVVFTTQHTFDDSVAIAKDIAKHSYKWTPNDAANPCKPAMTSTAYLICEGSMNGNDYRVDHKYIDEADPTPKSAWTLPMVIYLPTTGKAPFPTMIYGHGLGGDRTQGEQLAELAAPKGYAVVAVDAVKHGQHPDPHAKFTGSDQLDNILDFFGFSLSGQLIDSRKLRDNFRQSSYDKLQVVEALRPGIDVDNDGTTDVGLDRFMYLGVSLGGIMSAEFLSLTQDAQVGVPIVPGARITQIVQDGAQFKVVVMLFRSSASDGDVARFFPLLQTAIDRGDSGVYAPHILRNRFPGFDARTPEVLMQMVIDDDTVPNFSNLAFAGALGAPHVGDQLLTIPGIDYQPKLPISGNLDKTHTAGVFQYDVVYKNGGPMTQMATHGNVAANPVAISQTLHFIETHFSSAPSGAAEIIDPYRTLGIKN